MNPQFKKRVLSLLLTPLLLAIWPFFKLAFGGLDNRSPADAPKSKKEFKQHLIKAKSGEAYSEYIVCLGYYDGVYVEHDFVAAMAWCQLAAEQGLSQAQFYLGYMHWHGYEPAPSGKREPNYRKAFYWFNLGAKQGQSGSQYYLARLYENGRGTALDHNQALYWYQQAAQQRYAFAGQKINQIHERYQQFEQSLIQAKAGDAKAQWQVCSSCIAGRIKIESEIFPVRIDKNLIKQHCNNAINLGIAAAKQGLNEAQAELGDYYLHGKGVKKDIEQGLYWLKLSADNPDNYGGTELYLGNAYRDGKGVAQNTAQAIYWYERAAAKGRGDAKDYLKQLREQQ